jgi:hypothetical protein
MCTIIPASIVGVKDGHPRQQSGSPKLLTASPLM